MEDVLELVSRIHLLWKRHVSRGLAPHAVNPKQIFLLRMLRESGPLTPSDIAELLFADRPSVTSMLGTMERAGWISRRRDPDNGKRVLVELTEPGRDKLRSVPQRLWRTGKRRRDPAACLTAPEREALIALLLKLQAGIEHETGTGETVA